MDDLKIIVRRLRALATRADAMARRLEAHRTAGVISTNTAAVVGIAQIGTACRDFHSSVADAITALPQELGEEK